MLKLTGMSYDVARFQARSAFSGTGFTTAESEMIVNHPVRRKIIATLMITGNIGFISFISSLVLSFLGAEKGEGGASISLLLRVLIMIGGMVFIYLISRSHFVDRILQFIIEKALTKWTKINVQDYESQLNLSGEYSVIQFLISEDSWLANRILEDLQLTGEGVLILGIKRTDGYYVGAPQRATMLYPGDEVVLYGREAIIRILTQRESGEEGEKEHREAVKKYSKISNRKIDNEA